MKMIDVHTHGMRGVDTSSFSADDMLLIAEGHGASGTGEVVLAVYPSDVENMRRNMGAVKKAMERQRDLPSESPAARIVGVHLEGPFLNPSRCGALCPGSFMKPSLRALREIVEGFEDIVKIMTIAPELESAPMVIRSMSDMGITASMGHSDATYAEAEKGYHSGARGITHIFNAMRGIHHREPGIAGFGLMNRDVYIEVIADPFHLDHRMIEFIFSVKGSERIIIVSDSVKGTGTGGVSCGITGKDGALLGGSMSLRDAAERLVHEGIDSEAVVKAVTLNPGRYLGLSGGRSA